MSVQPNPFREVLGVTYDAAAAAAVKVTVTDLQGKLLLEREFEVNKGRNELQIRDWGLAPGMYLLQLTDQQGTQTQKIVRE